MDGDPIHIHTSYSVSHRVETVSGHRAYLHFDEVMISTRHTNNAVSRSVLNNYEPLVLDVLLEIESQHLSTLAGYAAANLETTRINFQDLVWPYPFKSYLRDCNWRKKDCYTMTYGEYRPRVALPTQLLEHPALRNFSHCSLWSYGTSLQSRK